MKSILSALLLLLVASIGYSQSGTDTGNVAPPPVMMIPDPDYMPGIEILPVIPQEAAICGCRFAADQAAFAADQFVFASTRIAATDTAGAAFMTISGTIFRFTWVSTARNGNQVNHVFEGHPYTLTLSYTELTAWGESAFVEGTLTLTDPNNKTVTQPVFGKCGC